MVASMSLSLIESEITVHFLPNEILFFPFVILISPSLLIRSLLVLLLFLKQIIQKCNICYNVLCLIQSKNETLLFNASITLTLVLHYLQFHYHLTFSRNEIKKINLAQLWPKSSFSLTAQRNLDHEGENFVVSHLKSVPHQCELTTLKKNFELITIQIFRLDFACINNKLRVQLFHPAFIKSLVYVFP